MAYWGSEILPTSVLVTSLLHSCDATTPARTPSSPTPNPFSKGDIVMLCRDSSLKSPHINIQKENKRQQGWPQVLFFLTVVSGIFLSSATHPLQPYLYPGPAFHDGGSLESVQSKWGPDLLGMHQFHPSKRDRSQGGKKPRKTCNQPSNALEYK